MLTYINIISQIKYYFLILNLQIMSSYILCFIAFIIFLINFTFFYFNLRDNPCTKWKQVARCYKYTMINDTANVIMSAFINITDSKMRVVFITPVNN